RSVQRIGLRMPEVLQISSPVGYNAHIALNKTQTADMLPHPGRSDPNELATPPREGDFFAHVVAGKDVTLATLQVESASNPVAGIVETDLLAPEHVPFVGRPEHLKAVSSWWQDFLVTPGDAKVLIEYD